MAIPVFGTDFGKGAYRWLSLGFISFQPSELIKPFYVILASWLFVSSIEKAGLPGISISIIISLLVVISLVLQPDFGQASLIIATWSIIYFVSGAPVIFLFIVAASVAVFAFYIFKSVNYVSERVLSFLSNEVDPLSQIGRAHSAIQEGGYFGVGLGEGNVKVHLPDAHTDFIIAVAAEEYGLVLCFFNNWLDGFSYCKVNSTTHKRRKLFYSVKWSWNGRHHWYANIDKFSCNSATNSI